MDWLIITSDAGKKIVPVAKWLLNKYVTGFKIRWIDLGNQHIEKWCINIYNAMEKMELSDYVIFSLDDHLVFSNANIPLAIDKNLDRLELGQRWSHHKSCIERGDYFEYTSTTLYQVSTQISIWKKKSLMKILLEIRKNPWEFEIKGRCKAGILKSPAMRFIAESAISKRKPGMINLNGIDSEDRDELIELGLINESEIVNSWK